MPRKVRGIRVVAIVLAGNTPLLSGCSERCHAVDPKDHYRFERGDRCTFVLPRDGRLELSPQTLVLRPDVDQPQPIDGASESTTGEDGGEESSAARDPNHFQEVTVTGRLGPQPADGYQVFLELRACDSRLATNPARSAVLVDVDDGCTTPTHTTARCTLDPDGVAMLGVSSKAAETDGHLCITATSGKAPPAQLKVEVQYGFVAGERVRFRGEAFDASCGDADNPCVVPSPALGNLTCGEPQAICTGLARSLVGSARVEDASGALVSKKIDIAASVSASGRGAGQVWLSTTLGGSLCDPSLASSSSEARVTIRA
jgi:hypothetical protein